MNKTSVDAGYKALKDKKEKKKYDTKGLTPRTFDFLEWLSYFINETIDELLERAVLSQFKDWMPDYKEKSDKDRLKTTPYRSHMFNKLRGDN